MDYKKKWIGRFAILILITAAIVAYQQYNLGQYLSLDALKANQEKLTIYYQNHFFYFVSVFAGIYILATALSIPGAAVMTLAAGAIFGLVIGTVVVSFASTIGATLAFLGSRFLFKDWVQNKFRKRMKKMNEGFEKEGAFYLLTLRLVPLFPFFLINLVMGLTPIRTITYFFVSQLGMLPGTIVYVNAGTQLAKIDSMGDIVSPSILISFAIIGLMPILSKKMVTFLKVRKYLRRYKKPKKFDYNLVAIGGGSAGLVSAYIGAAVKAKVALIEKHKMGGDCLNTGCVPSKALIKSAKVAAMAKKSEEYGISASLKEIDFSKVMGRIHNVIKKIEPHDSVERYESLGVNCYKGEAKIKSPYEIEINGETITTKNIIIATGARPFVPPIKGIEDISYLTSDSLWEIKEKPKRLVVLGGGPIGSELAQSFARLGSEVSLVEMQDRVMAKEDPDVSEFIKNRFEKEGIHLYLGHKAVAFEKDGGIKKLKMETSSGKTKTIEFDEVLIAIGRKANTKGFGLEELDIVMNKDGTLEVDENMRTRYPNIFACGDVAGPYQFTHMAAHQAWFCAVNALFAPFKTFKVDYSVVPWCTYTDPEVAKVGLNEQEAKEQDIEYEITRYGLDDLDRAITEGEDYGFVKVLTEKGKDKILGATIVGDHAGDIIVEYIAAMKHGFGLNKILGTIHIYPTLGEANKFAAGVWKKQNAPEGLLKWVEKFHKFRRS